ncbi:hypothetical protein L21SP2_3434 [Salinispira pacifica]|uniref:Uncharacterized protein n=1 Tax=Salinispira pacifica TaxID=1307761 RepID=V5WLH8_9SPIO|nr:hypothetical protein L21SP2_3434 [Salinispira pacifica]
MRIGQTDLPAFFCIHILLIVMKSRGGEQENITPALGR